VYAGVKTYAEDKLDVGILLADAPAAAAGVFTLNRVKSKSVVLTQERVEAGRVRAVVAVSGIANAVVEAGMRDAVETTALAAQRVGVEPEEMAICTTGLIGVELPMGLVRAGIARVELSHHGGDDFARSIMTTDRGPKSAAVRVGIGGMPITIGGCVKGAGMIHPQMATMLGFLTTDAAVEPGFLKQALAHAVDDTFNMVTVDGDGSTNDTVLLLANGQAGNTPLNADSPDAAAFVAGLHAVADYLCKELVREAEGSQRIFSVNVHGARSREDAQAIARAVASSSLVKSAIHGSDPNWGRVLAAAGRAGAEVAEDKVTFYINDVCIMDEGLPISFHREAVVVMMKQPEVALTLNLGLGDASATAWGCELSEEYVTFNSAYTT
ncbi:MAG: bifunctional glutamate N-acetyltransferase/amino-acid acetyltransferase ArgJ, partial [Chloroflexota bacterium]|nr:bifunctional glutamate N-acetyltransferase/amino-acid acetyltransferase ArgJ [Chloroflexota bacterium]